MLTIAAIALEAEEHLAPIIAPPWVFAAIAAGIFVVLGFVTFSFRDVSNRTLDKSGPDSGHDAH